MPKTQEIQLSDPIAAQNGIETQDPMKQDEPEPNGLQTAGILNPDEPEQQAA